MATLRAVARLNELLDAKSEAVAADATTSLLSLAGVIPAEHSATGVNVGITPGYVVTASRGDRVGAGLSLIEPQAIGVG